MKSIIRFLVLIGLACSFSASAEKEITSIDVDEILIEDEIDEKSEEEKKVLSVNSNPVKTTCTLTNKKNDGYYRSAKLVAKNKTNSAKTCTFRCMINQKNGRQRDFNCRATISGNTTATVCRINSSSHRFKSVDSVSDSNPC